MDHPIDRRGRCRSCRRLGAVLAPRWRRCRVYGKTSVWLHQPDEALLLRLLAHELELAAAPRLVWSETAPVPDLRLPLATVEPEQCGDREPEATADGAPNAN